MKIVLSLLSILLFKNLLAHTPSTIMPAAAVSTPPFSVVPTPPSSPRSGAGSDEPRLPLHFRMRYFRAAEAAAAERASASATAAAGTTAALAATPRRESAGEGEGIAFGGSGDGGALKLPPSFSSRYAVAVDHGTLPLSSARAAAAGSSRAFAGPSPTLSGGASSSVGVSPASDTSAPSAFTLSSESVGASCYLPMLVPPTPRARGASTVAGGAAARVLPEHTSFPAIVKDAAGKGAAVKKPDATAVEPTRFPIISGSGRA